MYKKTVICVFLILAVISCSRSQGIYTTIPEVVQPDVQYLFYLHGGIIQSRGIDAVSPYWGRYEYTAILDTLANHGFIVISEARPADTDLPQYAAKIARQIESLIQHGVPENKITVVGASMGAGITLDISIQVKYPNVKYAVMGICRDRSWQSYLSHYPKEDIRFHGHFLSIYEQTDTYGSCKNVIGSNKAISSFSEVALNMNNGHGFLYKPYHEWVNPLVQWIRRNKDDY